MTNKTIEVYFSSSGYTPLYKSELKKNELFFFDEDFTKGDLKNINIAFEIDPNKHIRIWSSKINIHEYLNFLYICNKFEGENISVIFTDDYDKDAYSVGALSKNEIKNLLKYEKKLSKDDILYYKSEWERLINKNNEIRTFINKKIKNVDYSFFDNYLIQHYNKDKKTWIINLMINDTINHYSEDFYNYLIDKYNNKK